MRDVALPSVQRRDDPDRRPRPAVQVPARAVRGRVPVARPSRRAGTQGGDRDPGRRADVRAGARHARGLAAVPRRARGARHRVHRAEPGRRARRAEPRRPCSRAASGCPTTSSSGSRSTACRPWSRSRASPRTAGSRSTATRSMTPFPDVYAVGDCVAHPDGEGRRVRRERRRRRRRRHHRAAPRRELGRRYEGEGNCYLEFGSGRVAKVEANFLGGPSPTATVVGPSEDLAAEKAEFGWSRRKRWFGAYRRVHHSRHGRASRGNGHVPLHRHRGVDATAARARPRPVRRGARRASADRARGGGRARRSRGRHAGRRVLHRVPDSRRSSGSRARRARRARRGRGARADGPAHRRPHADRRGVRRAGRPPRSAHRRARARRPDPRLAEHGGAARLGAAPRPRPAPAQGLRRRGSPLPARRSRVPAAPDAGERRAPDSGHAVSRPRAGAVRRRLAGLRARSARPHDRRPGRNRQDAVRDRARAPAR